MLERRFQRTPLRFLTPRRPPDDAFLGVLVNTGGGLVGGDVLNTQIELSDQAQAIITGQAAEKVYRSAGPTTVVDTSLTVGPDAILEVLPQGTILFDESCLDRTTDLSIIGSGRALVGELLVLGRTAHGETLSSVSLRETWRVSLNNRPIWFDRLILGRDADTLIGASAGFNGARALGTAIYTGWNASELLETARSLLDDHDVLSGVTCLGPMLIIRWIGPDALRLRQAMGTWWARFRAAALDRPESLPVVWAI